MNHIFFYLFYFITIIKLENYHEKKKSLLYLKKYISPNKVYLCENDVITWIQYEMREKKFIEKNQISY